MTLRYRPDLDGLRAVAVCLVIATHAHLPMTNNGGDAGVTAFFVLSGYLISRLLLDERAATGRIDLLGFYRRRVRRLGPALIVLLAFVALASRLVTWPGAWPIGLGTSVFYVSNWVQVGGINIDPLGHTWSLAIEEQFYLVWPAVILLVGSRRLAWISLGLIIAGTIARTMATDLFEYFSTVTRGEAILVGCLAALLGIRVPRWASPIGLAALIGVAYLNLSHDLTIPVAELAAVLIVTADWSPLGRLAPIGKRAYALYLWDWPLHLAFGVVSVPLTFIAAELSWRFIERPFLARRPAPAPPPDTAAGPLPVAAPDTAPEATVARATT